MSQNRNEIQQELADHYRAVRARITAPREWRSPAAPIPVAPPRMIAPPVREESEGGFQRACRILNEVAAEHGVTIEGIRGECRTRVFVEARHHAFWRLRNETGWSTPRIGRFVGDKDHTTVLHGIERHSRRIIGQPV